jgi:hypothetical protein
LNKIGRPINANEFRKTQWYRTLRRLDIDPRDFYSTKDTVISLDITAGENVKKVAQEAGISLATLERNYGVYLDKAVQREVQRNVPKKRKALQNKS